jgi:hypothetical protein
MMDLPQAQGSVDHTTSAIRGSVLELGGVQEFLSHITEVYTHGGLNTSGNTRAVSIAAWDKATELLGLLVQAEQLSRDLSNRLLSMR